MLEQCTRLEFEGSLIVGDLMLLRGFVDGWSLGGGKFWRVSELWLCVLGYGCEFVC